MARQANSSFPRIIAVGALVCLLVGSGWWWWQREAKPATNQLPNDYQTVIQQTASAPLAQTESQVKVSLTTMLADGIMTKQGLLQSKVKNHNNVTVHVLSLNQQELSLKAVSEIELVQGFQLGESQIMLFGYDQGGNQCSRLYQVLTVDATHASLSQPFGSCLPLISSQATNDSIIFTMPQNNPYLGPDVVVKYEYHNDKVKLLSKSSRAELKQKYAALTASKILAIAQKDGCYVDGVLLEDNSCGNGRKYCVMFKNLNKPVHDADYQTLKSFCN